MFEWWVYFLIPKRWREHWTVDETAKYLFTDPDTVKTLVDTGRLRFNPTECDFIIIYAASVREFAAVWFDDSSPLPEAYLPFPPATIVWR